MQSFLPPMVGANLPPASPVTGVTDDERGIIAGLSIKMSLQASLMRLLDQYYEGTQRMTDLGISIPPALANIRTVVDWPRICIDPLIDRAKIEGFRLPGSTDIDDELQAYWQSNSMDAEAPLTFLDSLVYGRGYMIGGSPDTYGDDPIISVESPFNLAMNWDPRTRRGTAAYQSYETEGMFVAVLYGLNVDVHMSRTGTSAWQVDDRDEHNLGELCVVRFPNRSRTKDREGTSQITPAIRNTTDSAVRTLLGMEIAREFYSVPQKWAVGVSESDFQDADGNALTAWQASMNKFLALERDETGAAPEMGQFTAYDPSVYTKIVDEHATLMASYTGFPPSYFGQTTSANPASADAIRVAESGLNRTAERVNNQFSDPAESMARLTWRIAHNGADVPAEFMRLETDWADVATATPAATADAMLKQVQMGAVVPTSSVVLKALGYNAVQRAQLAKDREADGGASLLLQVANTLQARAAKTDNSLITTIQAGQDPQSAPKPSVPGAGSAPPALPAGK